MKMRSGWGVLRAILSARLGHRKPVAVCWKITEACNGHCQYCSYGKAGAQELGLEPIVGIMRQMKSEGVQLISFTGGEPLMRPDMGAILQQAKKLGLYVKLNTNGILLGERIEAIKNIDVVQLSFDGKEDVNDRVRHRGHYGHLMSAMRVVKSYRIPVYLNTVVSRFNYDRLEEVVHFCKEHKVASFFQPARVEVLGSDEKNPVSLTATQYQQAMKVLTGFKRSLKYRRQVLNSLTGLRYLRHWPEPSKIPCYAGIVSVRLDENGFMYICDEYRELKGVNVVELGFKKALLALSSYRCQECWCGSQAESNFVFNFNAEALLNLMV